MIRVEVSGAGPCSGLLLLPPKTAARWQAVRRRLACHQLALLAETLLQLAEKHCRQRTLLEDSLSETPPAAQPCTRAGDKSELQSGGDPAPVSSAATTRGRSDLSGPSGTSTGSCLCDLRSADYHHQRSEVTWGHGAAPGQGMEGRAETNQLIPAKKSSLSEDEPADVRRSTVVTTNRPEGAPWREASVSHMLFHTGASRDHVTTNTAETRDYATLQSAASRDRAVTPSGAARDQQVSVIFNVESLERTSNHASNHMIAETRSSSGRAPTTARSNPPQRPAENSETQVVGTRNADRGAIHGGSVPQSSSAGVGSDSERRRPSARPPGLTRPCVLRRGRAICSTDGLTIDDAVGSVENATSQTMAGAKDKSSLGGVNCEDNDRVASTRHKSYASYSGNREDCDAYMKNLRGQVSAENQNQRTSPTAKVPNDPTTHKEAPAETSPEKMSSLSLCCDCDTEHSPSSCPLRHPLCWIQDSPGGSAAETLPACLRLDGSTVRAGPDGLAAYTLFGPLVGRPIAPEQLGESVSLRHIWEVYGEGVFLDTSDPAASSWFHLLRPAVRRSQRTLAVVTRQRRLFAVTTCHLVAGDELTYWQDDSETTWRGKNMLKTRCGGCNVTFEHPLFYRRHCSLFHEPGTPLTVRKYYCKVCGESVMGRQKLLCHATEKHEGAGAYQCQHCGKFFRRQSYLELHRNHGCAANPQRTHPLCHLCGARFSQPQKLKMHIRRVHSDADPSVADCRCERCGRLLGCRTALRRHLREVHLSPEQAQSALTCRRCGKQFQNGSNLKIHMLTHSGVKPFRCSIADCGSAFTTKQCLQQHYGRVHLLTGSSVPPITRSVPYTLRGYSGQLAESPPPPPTGRRRPLCRADRLRFTDFSVSRDLPEPSSGPRLLQDASRSELDSIEPSLILGAGGSAGRETEM